MSAMMQSLGIDQLSREERWQLVEEICQSLFNDPGDFLSPDQMEELKECLEDDRRNPDEGSPWREVMARLKAE